MRRFATAVVSVALVITLSRAEDWAVHLDDQADANEVAEAHGLMNAGEVIPDSGVYHFRLPAEARRRKRSVHDGAEIAHQLRAHPSIHVAEEQESLVRVKRAPPGSRQIRAPEEVCFINTEVRLERVCTTSSLVVPTKSCITRAMELVRPSGRVSWRRDD